MSDPSRLAGGTFSRRLVPFGLGGLLVAGVLLAGVPWIAHRFLRQRFVGDNLLAKPGRLSLPAIAGCRASSSLKKVHSSQRGPHAAYGGV